MDEFRQVVVHPVVWPHLEAWLRQRNISLNLLSFKEDDLPTYVMGFVDEPAPEGREVLRC